MNRSLLIPLALALLALPLLLTGEASAQGKNPVVVMKTSMGDIKIELYPDKSPATVKNFLQYVDEKHYDGTIFHRVIPTFMIQGGGMDADMREKPTHEPIKNEAGNGLANSRGTLAMARTSNPHSASAQFFINVKDNSFLDKANAQDGWGYAVFGRVVDGMDVVDRIKQVATTSRGGHQNVPEQPVIVRSIRRK